MSPESTAHLFFRNSFFPQAILSALTRSNHTSESEIINTTMMELPKTAVSAGPLLPSNLVNLAVIAASYDRNISNTSSGDSEAKVVKTCPGSAPDEWLFLGFWPILVAIAGVTMIVNLGVLQRIFFNKRFYK